MLIRGPTRRVDAVGARRNISLSTWQVKLRRAASRTPARGRSAGARPRAAPPWPGLRPRSGRSRPLPPPYARGHCECPPTASQCHRGKTVWRFRRRHDASHRPAVGSHRLRHRARGRPGDGASSEFADQRQPQLGAGRGFGERRHQHRMVSRAGIEASTRLPDHRGAEGQARRHAMRRRAAVRDLKPAPAHGRRRNNSSGEPRPHIAVVEGSGTAG